VIERLIGLTDANVVIAASRRSVQVGAPRPTDIRSMRLIPLSDQPHPTSPLRSDE
jgi:hypothetical protein